MKVLVTGAAGFIGSHLVDHLLARGNKVVAVDNFEAYYDVAIKRNNCAEHLKNSHYKLYEGDLCNFDFLADIFKREAITHIVHLAASAGVRPSVEDPVFYQHNNGASTVNLLELMSRTVAVLPNGKANAKYDASLAARVEKFVFASSSSVYGERLTAPFKETEDVSRPISPYAATKIADEAMAHCFHYLYAVPTIGLRFFTVYGPRQRPDLAIHKFAKLIRDGKTISVYGDGSARRDFTYIDDIIDGVIRSVDLANCGYEIFNLGESETTDVRNLIALLEKSLGQKAVVEYLDPIPGDVPLTCADITKSRAVLGYNPKTKIEAGLEKFAKWFKAS